jgi:hypothetical protein
MIEAGSEKGKLVAYDRGKLVACHLELLCVGLPVVCKLIGELLDALPLLY